MHMHSTLSLMIPPNVNPMVCGQKTMSCALSCLTIVNPSMKNWFEANDWQQSQLDKTQ